MSMTTLYHPTTGKRQDVPAGAILLRFALLNSGWRQDEPAPAVESDDDMLAGWQAAINLRDLAQHMNMVRLLVVAGYVTPEAVQMATDEELLAIKGIGPKSLAALRAVLGAG